MADNDRTDSGYTSETDDDSEYVLWGRALRFVLVDELRKRGTLTVAEMVRTVHRYGFSVEKNNGPPNQNLRSPMPGMDQRRNPG